VPTLAAGGNQLRRFLTDVREGYCEQFAAAMAVMARLQGVPARVAVGFTPGEIVDNTYQQVTTKDAHAWPELWFPEAGWVRFEPTPRGDGQVRLPSYTTPAGRVTGPDAPETAPPTTAGGPTQPTRNLPPEPELNTPDDPALGTQQDRARWLRHPVARIGLSVLLLVVLVPGVKWARNAVARRRAGHRPRDAVSESYVELTSWTRDAGIGRQAAETPAAYARRLSGDFAADADPLVELTSLFERAEYGAAEPAGDQAHRARRLARSARAQLSGRLGWRRRLVAAVNPRSLLTPRPASR